MPTQLSTPCRGASPVAKPRIALRYAKLPPSLRQASGAIFIAVWSGNAAQSAVAPTSTALGATRAAVAAVLSQPRPEQGIAVISALPLLAFLTGC